MEGRRFSFKFVSKSSFRCDKLNVAKGSAYIKLNDRLKYENVRINPKNIDGKCFHYTFVHTQHYKEINNNRNQVSNVKTFIGLYIVGKVYNIQQT